VLPQSLDERDPQRGERSGELEVVGFPKLRRGSCREMPEVRQDHLNLDTNFREATTCGADQVVFAEIEAADKIDAADKVLARENALKHYKRHRE
jgi:hypothetical protein